MSKHKQQKRSWRGFAFTAGETDEVRAALAAIGAEWAEEPWRHHRGAIVFSSAGAKARALLAKLTRQEHGPEGVPMTRFADQSHREMHAQRKAREHAQMYRDGGQNE